MRDAGEARLVGLDQSQLYALRRGGRVSAGFHAGDPDGRVFLKQTSALFSLCKSHGPLDSLPGPVVQMALLGANCGNLFPISPGYCLMAGILSLLSGNRMEP